jgi:hypothetical protein
MQERRHDARRSLRAGHELGETTIELPKVREAVDKLAPEPGVVERFPEARSELLGQEKDETLFVLPSAL